MADRVAALWSEIIDWLRQNAPADAGRLRPPASRSVIDEVQAAVGCPLPEDLRQWWQQADGAIRVAGVYLIPWGFAPIACRDAVKDREMRVQMWSEDDLVDEDLDDAEFGDDQAGDLEYFGFHPRYLPIGDDHCGNCVYVDLRDGPEYGFIKFFDHEDPSPNGFLWRGISEMLTEIRDALIDHEPGLDGKALRAVTSGEAFPAYRAAVTAERELRWVPQKLGQPR